MPRYKTREIRIQPAEVISALLRSGHLGRYVTAPTDKPWASKHLRWEDPETEELEGATIRVGGNTGDVIVTLREGIEDGAEVRD